MSNLYFIESRDLINNLQTKFNFIIQPNQYPENWNDFINEITKFVPINDFYLQLNKIKKTDYIKPKGVFFKSVNFAISEKIIFITDPNLYDEPMFKNHKITIISKEDFNNIEIVENKKIINEKKLEVELIDFFFNSITGNVKKIIINIKKNNLSLISYKNKRLNKIEKYTNIKIEEIEEILNNIKIYIKDIFKKITIDIDIKQITNENKEYIFKINDLNIISLKNFNINKKNKESLENAIQNKSGIIFINALKNSGKTTILKAIAQKILDDKRLVSVYTNENSFNSLNVDIYKNVDKIEETETNVIIYDKSLNDNIFNDLIFKSLSGKLVIISLEVANCFDSLQYIYYKFNNLKKEILVEELIGLYAQEIIPVTDKMNTEIIKISDINENEIFKMSELYEYDKDILIEKENTEILYNENINENFVICSEWIDNNKNIKNNFKNNFDINNIMVEQKSLKWLSILDVSLDYLNKNIITINDLRKFIKIK